MHHSPRLLIVVNVSRPEICSEEGARYYTKDNIDKWTAVLKELPDDTGLLGRCA